MVSLRERKARASYTNIAQGLSDLSSSGEEDNAEASGSGVARDGIDNDNDSAQDGAGAQQDDASSISSGGSSEFRPDSASPEKVKGKAVGSADDHDDDGEELMNELVDENDDEGGSDLNEVNEEDIDPVLRSSRPSTTATPDPVRATNVPKAKPRPKARSRPSASTPVAAGRTSTPRASAGGSSATYAAHGQSSVNHLPSSYRKLIRESTVSIAKPTQVQRVTEAGTRKEREKDSTSVYGPQAFPAGHPLPYSTRLNAPPSRRDGGQIGWIDESVQSSANRREDYKQNGWSEKDRIPLASPWQVWRGEGWWPETYVGKEGEASGKRSDWILKEEVRLGLNEVGRYKRADLVILAEIEAEPYLPTPMNKDGDPWITVHMGPHDAQQPRNFSFLQSTPFAQTNPLVPREGYTFFAGGPIWGMDWCPCPSAPDEEGKQYLAVSTLPHIDTRPAMGEKWPRDSQGSIQIWSLIPAQAGPSGQGNARSGKAPVRDADNDIPMNDANRPDSAEGSGSMRCEMILCLRGGPAMEVRWMPLGASDPESNESDRDQLPKLGILAAVQLDGSVSFYAVPPPRSLRRRGELQTIYLQAHKPLLRLDIPDTSCMCFDWVTGSRIAVGLADGHVAIWDILEPLKQGEETPLPSMYTSVALSAIRSISVGRVPPLETRLDGDPIFLVTGAYDGSTMVVDMRDPGFPIEMSRMRIPSMAVGWAAQLASPLLCDIDYIVSAIKVRKGGAGRHHPLASHRGQVWDLATSDYHTMLLTAGSDGALLLSDLHNGFYRRRKTPLVFQRVYEVDYHSHSGEYRILDNFLPENLGLEAASARRPPSIPKRATHDPHTNILKTAAWSPHVGIHKVAWQSAGGLGRAGWCVSGGASGLGRVEWVEGSWKGMKVYGA